MVKKIISYVIALVGLVVVLLSFGKVRSAILPSFPAYITDNMLIAIGLVIVIIGVGIVLRMIQQTVKNRREFEASLATPQEEGKEEEEEGKSEQ